MQSTDAATLATALHQRCDSLLKDRGIPVILILNADKASSCVSVACHEAATFAGGRNGNMSLYGNCMMHMVFAAFGGAVAPLKQIGPMFSATSLIHRANNMSILRKYVRKIVREDLQVLSLVCVACVFLQLPRPFEAHHSSFFQLPDQLPPHHHQLIT